MSAWIIVLVFLVAGFLFLKIGRSMYTYGRLESKSDMKHGGVFMLVCSVVYFITSLLFLVKAIS